MNEKKTYTINDFKPNTYAYKPIVATGYINSYSGSFDINDSSILTELIHEAGRYCEQFASDLFLDWQNVVSFIADAEPGDSKTYLFGFRQQGVDHDSFIFSRFNQYGYHAKHEYRSLWRLDIAVSCDELTMKLGRVF